MNKFCTIFVVGFMSIAPGSLFATPLNQHLELAAKINAAENICDINFGKTLLHHVMLAAADLGVSVPTAARMANARQAQIVRQLNKHHKLDAFCSDARNGSL